MATSPRCSTCRAIASRNSPREADPHRTADPAQLGRARPRAFPPHQLRRSRDGVLPVPTRPRAKRRADGQDARRHRRRTATALPPSRSPRPATCIGFVGLHAAEIEPLVPAGSIEIGWRLAPEFWGLGYVTEAAEALLDFGFDTLGLRRNHLLRGLEQFPLDRRDAASRHARAIRRRFRPPRVPDTHPDLKRHALYRLSRDDWLARKERRADENRASCGHCDTAAGRPGGGIFIEALL